MEGFVKKYANFFKRWKTKYIIVNSYCISFYSKDKSKLSYSMPLYNSIITTKSEKSKSITITFENKQSIFLKAFSTEEKIKWLSVLDKASHTKAPENAKIKVMPNVDDIFSIKEKIIKLLKTSIFNQNSQLDGSILKLSTNISLVDSKVLDIINLLMSEEKCQKISEEKVSEEIKEKANNELTIKEISKEKGIQLFDLCKDLMNCNEILKSNLNDIGMEIENVKAEFLKVSKNLVGIMEPENQNHEPSRIKDDELKDENFYNEVFFDAEEITLPNKTQKIEEDEPKVRTMLPVPFNNKHKISIWTILKDMIGQDLTHFSLPVYFNMPISLIQRTCGCMENDYLLDKANLEPNSFKRIAFIAAFNLAQFNSLLGMTRKPFNPLLGETYEYVCERFKVMGEQVSHHPPVSAIYAENNNFTFEADTQLKLSFWGKSVECIPIGYMKAYLKKTQEYFRIKRPIVSTHNLIIGKLYIDLSGETSVENLQTKECCIIKCHLKGWSQSSWSKFDGGVYNANKEKKFEIFGKWLEQIFLKDLETNETTLIWERKPLIDHWEENYCFSLFELQLNYLTKELKEVLPPTDSRYRPDQRLVEMGDLIQAQKEKVRIENKQRAFRKEMEEKKIKYKPLYFDEEFNKETKCVEYHFNHRYWIDRENHDWSKCQDLF